MERQPGEYGHELAFPFWKKEKKIALTLPNLSHKITTSVQEIATTRYFCKDLISTFLYYPLWCMTMQHIGPRCEPNS